MENNEDLKNEITEEMPPEKSENEANEKKPAKSKCKIANIVCLSLVGVIYLAVVLFNLFQPDRATFSENEQRNLSEMPKFSFQSLASGEYFKGLSSFISDTFCYRETMVDASKKLDALKGVTVKVGGGNLIVIDGGHKETEETEDEEELNRLIEEALRKAQTSEEDTTPEVTTETAEDTTDVPTTDDSTETADVTDTEPVPAVQSVELDKTKVNIYVGSTVTIKCTVKAEEGADTDPTWSTDNKTSITVKKKDEGALVTAVTPGTAILTCTVGDVKATCTIIVSKPSTGGDGEHDDEYEFLKGGLFIFNDAAFVQGSISSTKAKNLNKMCQVYDKMFEGTRINVLVAPVSSIIIDNPEVVAKIHNQRSSLGAISQYFDPNINYVNIAETMFAHRKEYLYFKTDHHWTDLGAYYAYCDFIKSIGLEPYPLDAFEKKVLSEEWHGSMYKYTKDERVRTFKDVIEAYIPPKKCKMTVTFQTGNTGTYNWCINQKKHTYLAFICGDNPYTVINVPENPQDMSILVFKDSYGDPFVPYLTMHYGNIIVVDPRYCEDNLYDQFKDYGLDDILFLNNIQCANSASWLSKYYRAIGINY